MNTILLVDNEEDVRTKAARFLSTWYTILQASSVSDARDLLGKHSVDLLIIDVRLENHTPRDDSGLEFAKDKRLQHYPKIMWTGYIIPYSEQRQVWESVGGEPPCVMGFVGKGEGPEALRHAIENALQAWPRITLQASRVANRIEKDHDRIRTQAWWFFVASCCVALLGFVLIVLSIVGVWVVPSAINFAAMASGILLEAIGYLFFTRFDLANRRMDDYHRELMQTYGVEFLLSVAERLPAAQQADVTQDTIRTVLSSWYPASNQRSITGSGASEMTTMPDKPMPTKVIGAK